MASRQRKRTSFCWSLGSLTSLFRLSLPFRKRRENQLFQVDMRSFGTQPRGRTLPETNLVNNPYHSGLLRNMLTRGHMSAIVKLDIWTRQYVVSQWNWKCRKFETDRLACALDAYFHKHQSLERRTTPLRLVFGSPVHHPRSCSYVKHVTFGRALGKTAGQNTLYGNASALGHKDEILSDRCRSILYQFCCESEYVPPDRV